MNKKVKRIIACTIAIAAVSAVMPAKNINLIMTKAYADSSDKAYLNDIDVSHGNLSFSKTDTSYTVRVGSSEDDVKIDVSADSNYEVTIDGYSGDSHTVDLKKGDNRIRIKVRDKTGVKDPVTYYLNIIRGHNSSYSSDYEDDIYLDDITVNEGSLDFYRKTSNYTINVSSAVDEIKIKAKPENTGDIVKIDGTTVDESDNYRKTLSLGQGTNTIKVIVEDDNGDHKRTYTLYVNRGASTATTTSSGEVDTRQDSIYLDDLLIDNGNTPLSFSQKVTTYNVNVSKACDEIIIKAEPEDGSDVARVNGDKVDRDYKKLVKLNEGKNEIKVKVSNEDDDFEDNEDYEDNYEERTYTINVYRGSGSNTTTDSTNITIKPNQWVSVMGRWQYNDSLGKALVSTWYSDRGNGKIYYLDSQGYMATGWINLNGTWYYLDENGARQSGWKQINGKWYYLDSEGKMVYNTTIGGYKLGADGAWA